MKRRITIVRFALCGKTSNAAIAPPVPRESMHPIWTILMGLGYSLVRILKREAIGREKVRPRTNRKSLNSILKSSGSVKEYRRKRGKSILMRSNFWDQNLLLRSRMGVRVRQLQLSTKDKICKRSYHDDEKNKTEKDKQNRDMKISSNDCENNRQNASEQCE